MAEELTEACRVPAAAHVGQTAALASVGAREPELWQAELADAVSSGTFLCAPLRAVGGEQAHATERGVLDDVLEPFGGGGR